MSENVQPETPRTVEEILADIHRLALQADDLRQRAIAADLCRAALERSVARLRSEMARNGGAQPRVGTAGVPTDGREAV